MYDPRLVAEYIRQAAAQRGINPDVALRVAKSEGLGEYVGDGGSSFGPYQLHYGGVAKGGNSVGGLGDTFTKRTGLDARNPDTWRQQVDFSLDEAKRGGWGPWHGWKGAPMAGIGGRPADIPASAASPTSAGGFDRDALMALAYDAFRPASNDADEGVIADLLKGGAKKAENPIAGLLSAAQPQETQTQDVEAQRDAFFKQMMDFHNAQHLRAIQGLL
jgi:hypothetical protein